MPGGACFTTVRLEVRALCQVVELLARASFITACYGVAGRRQSPGLKSTLLRMRLSSRVHPISAICILADTPYFRRSNQIQAAYVICLSPSRFLMSFWIRLTRFLLSRLIVLAGTACSLLTVRGSINAVVAHNNRTILCRFHRPSRTPLKCKTPFPLKEARVLSESPLHRSECLE